MQQHDGNGKAFLMNKTKSQTFNERYRPTKAHIGAYIEKDLRERVLVVCRRRQMTMTDILIEALEEMLKKK